MWSKAAFFDLFKRMREKTGFLPNRTILSPFLAFIEFLHCPKPLPVNRFRGQNEFYLPFLWYPKMRLQN